MRSKYRFNFVQNPFITQTCQSTLNFQHNPPAQQDPSNKFNAPPPPNTPLPSLDKPKVSKILHLFTSAQPPAPPKIEKKRALLRVEGTLRVDSFGEIYRVRTVKVMCGTEDGFSRFKWNNIVEQEERSSGCILFITSP